MNKTYIIIGTIVLIVIVVLIVVFKVSASKKSTTNKTSANPNIIPPAIVNAFTGGSPQDKSCTFPLKRGLRCKEVMNLQIWLNITSDGIFGKQTESSLLAKTTLSYMTQEKYQDVLKDLAITTNINVGNQILTISAQDKGTIENLADAIYRDISSTSIMGHNTMLYDILNQLDDNKLKYFIDRYKLASNGSSFYNDLKSEYFLDTVTINKILSRLQNTGLV